LQPQAGLLAGATAVTLAPEDAIEIDVRSVLVDKIVSAVDEQGLMHAEAARLSDTSRRSTGARSSWCRPRKSPERFARSSSSYLVSPRRRVGDSVVRRARLNLRKRSQ
jgi:hypothetical protein